MRQERQSFIQTGKEQYVNQMATQPGSLPLPGGRTVPDALPQPIKDPKKGNRLRLAIGGALAAATVAVAGYGAYQNIDNNPQQQEQQIYQGPLGPAAGETVSWWQELSPEQIQQIAETPAINRIGNEYISTVSPLLQEKAKQAGYEIIYQGDPNDTTGRTVVTGERQASRDWTVEDNGFGQAGIHARGIFKEWAPDPIDPTQQEKIYAVLIDPTTNKEYTVGIMLGAFSEEGIDRPGYEWKSTFFVVDDLNIGPDYIKQKSKEVGYSVSSITISTAEKKTTDSPTFYNLLKKQQLKLTDLVQPGDYVSVVMNAKGFDENTWKDILNTDSSGVPQALNFSVRRFGGKSQWELEVQSAQP